MIAMKQIFFLLLCISSLPATAQRFDLGDPITPSSSHFKLLGISSATGVANYKYVKPITDIMFGRRIGEIVIGVKDGYIVTTIYNLIPDSDERGVPGDILKLINGNLPFPLTYINGIYGVNIDNYSISVSRTNGPLTFNKDRIMYLSSVKRSHLINK
jgi:hypothetical protein